MEIQDKTPPKQKARRKITEFDFSKEGSAVALVSASQGGAANQFTTLVTKATNKLSQETINKLQEVEVELELPEFIELFFGLSKEDALALAIQLGYEQEDEAEDSTEQVQSFMQRSIGSYAMMQKMKQSSIQEVVSDMQEDQYLGLIQDQKKLEGLIKMCSGKTKLKASVDSGDIGSMQADVSAPKKRRRSKLVPTTLVPEQEAQSDDAAVNAVATVVSKKSKHEVQADMPTQDVQAQTEQKEQKEQIEKAKFVELEKQLHQQQEQLNKALALVKQMEVEKQQRQDKQRQDELQQLLKQEQAEVIFKALQLHDDEQFNSVVGVLKSLVKQQQNQDIFKEVGVQVEDQQTPNHLASLLKAKYVR